MENRKPFQLRNILIVYNFVHVLISFYIFIEGGMAGWFGQYNWRCEPFNPSKDEQTMRVSWLIFIFKVFQDSFRNYIGLLKFLFNRWWKQHIRITSANFQNFLIRFSSLCGSDMTRFRPFMWFIMVQCLLQVGFDKLRLWFVNYVILKKHRLRLNPKGDSCDVIKEQSKLNKHMLS